MALEEEHKKKGDLKGFAGLSSMVTNVDLTSAKDSKPPQRAKSVTSTEGTRTSSRPTNEESAKPASQANQSPSPTRSKYSGPMVAIVFVVVVYVLMWAIFGSHKEQSYNASNSPSDKPSSLAPASTPIPVQIPAAKVSVPSKVVVPVEKPSAAKTVATSRPTEIQPSVGRNNILSVAEIRYCLAEKIRLDAGETVIDNYVASDVDRFNRYGTDYNSRCGEYRYRVGVLESAQADVEPYRAQFQAEGRIRLAPTTSAAPAHLVNTLPRTIPVEPSPERNNLKPTLPTTSFPHIPSSTSQSRTPANSWVSGSTWYCNDGYQKSGNSCVSIKAPANSWVSGSTWYCSDGYKKVGNSCISIYGQ